MPSKLLILIACALTCCAEARAIIIDDFSVGEVQLTGPSGYVDAVSLDPTHVVGGARRIHVESNIDLSITNGRLEVRRTTGGLGYFTLMYGFNSALAANLLENGHDRLRLTFGELGSEEASGIFWLSINTQLPPSSNAPGPGLSQVRGGAIIEIPLSLYGGNLAQASTLAIEVARMGGGFTLESVETAGPPTAYDFDRDGVVGSSDLDEFRHTFGKTMSTQEGYFSSDGNLDRRVDGADFLAWQRAVAASNASGARATPEPTAAAQLLAAATSFLFSRRLRRAQGREDNFNLPRWVPRLKHCCARPSVLSIKGLSALPFSC